MICLKCRAEIEDLSMYCPNCGAPQFAPKHDEEIVLELTDPLKSKIIVHSVSNLTAALSTIRKITDQPLSEIRTLLSELPAVLLSGLSVEDAEKYASQLKEAGIDASADSGAASVEEE